MFGNVRLVKTINVPLTFSARLAIFASRQKLRLESACEFLMKLDYMRNLKRLGHGNIFLLCSMPFYNKRSRTYTRLEPFLFTHSFRIKSIPLWKGGSG